MLSSVKADTPWLISKSVSFAKANGQIFKVYRLNDDMSLGTGPFKGRPFAILDNNTGFPTGLFGGNILLIRLKRVYRAITIMPDSDIIFLVGKNGEYWRIDSLNLKIKMPEPILENRVLERHDTSPSVQNVLLGQGLE